MDLSSPVFSVTSLTRALKDLVEPTFRFIRVQGEISNLKRPFSGHSYFTLKDDGAQLRGVLFKGQARYLEKALKDGQQVICHGRISIYEPRGDYQMIIDTVDFQGSGLLQVQFEELKKRLAAEGLFDTSRKRELPPLPHRVVLLTSPSGAAVHDFLKIWRERHYPATISIFPVRVQGAGAAEEIAEALAIVNREIPDADMVVLCRGGGSLEDLWAFNEEILARAIVASSLPVVSAVGHEVDFTISDFCADFRAPTPSGAAEQIFPHGGELKRQIRSFQERLGHTMHSRLTLSQQRLDQNRRLLGDMNFLFTHVSLRLDHTAERFLTIMFQGLDKRERACHELASRLHHLSPKDTLLLQEQRIRFAGEKLFYLLQKTLNDKEEKLGRQAALLDAVSPLATLARGYAIATRVDQKKKTTALLTGADQVAEGDRVHIRLHHGRVDCDVVAAKKEE